MNPNNYDDIIECVTDCIMLWIKSHRYEDHNLALDIILSMALGRVITPEDVAKFMQVYTQWRSE